MQRFFNTAGPCNPDDHYMLSATSRLPDLLPLIEGLEQLDGYLAGLGLDSGWLVIFDQRTGLPPIAERTSTEEEQSSSGRRITVIRG